MDMQNARKTFVQEAEELLEAMEKALLEVEHDGLTDEAMGAIFRAAHTIKGSSGLFGLDTMVSFTHVLENVFDRLRGGSLSYEPEMCALFLEAGDYLGRMVAAFAGGDDQPEPDPAARAALIGRLEAFLERQADRGVAKVPVAQGDGAFVLENDPQVESDNWHISLRLASDSLRNGLDPLSFFRYLERLGTIVRMEVVQDALPPYAEADPELLYLGFEIQFSSDADKKQIEDVFEFLSEGSRIRILPSEFADRTVRGTHPRGIGSELLGLERSSSPAVL